MGVSFWIGVGFQNGAIFPDLLGDGFWSVLLSNGMTAGGIVAVMLAAGMEFAGGRRCRIRLALDERAPQRVNEFLRSFTNRPGWDAAADRVAAAAEETLAIVSQSIPDDARAPGTLTLHARQDSEMVELEFAASLRCDNVEDRLAVLQDPPLGPDEEEVPYRLLLHYATDVRHQQYRGLDVVTVSVAAGE